MKKPVLPSFVSRIPPGSLYGILLFLIPALVYLPLAGRLGLYADDWYLVYAGQTQGIQKFWDVFIVDRPLRAFLVGGFYALFGPQASLYTYSGYFFRVAGGLALLWTLRMLWPKQRLSTLVISLLFIIYPGFMNQVNAIDYQSHLVSLCLALGSIAISIKAFSINNRWKAAGLWLLSTLLALIYLGLMEYYVGLEAFRFIAIGILVLRGRQDLLSKIRQLPLRWLPYFTAPVVFLVWRLVFFQNQRGATNVGNMMSTFSGSPVMRGLWMLVDLVQDLFNTILFAWAIPFSQATFNLRLRDFLLALGLGVVTAAAALILLGLIRTKIPPDAVQEGNWRSEAIFLGLASCLLALVPVSFGQRHIVFPAYSRFTLPASVGAVILLVAFLSSIKPQRFRSFLVFIAVLIAVMVQFGLRVNAANATAIIRDFWWQTAWRAPNIKESTTLLVNYPGVEISEDYFIWSPANLIYYPEKKNASPTPLSLSAAILNTDTAMGILGEAPPQTRDRRGMLQTSDYSNLLILSQPTPGSCVQILDGKNLELSSKEAQDIMLVARYSKIENLIPQGQAPSVPVNVFGSEPAHDWCYYYEKVALARQQGSWQEAARLGDEATQRKLHPSDGSEWLPLLQAYAHLGREDRLRALAPIINEDRFLGRQVCEGVKNQGGYYQGIGPQVSASLQGLFCK